MIETREKEINGANYTVTMLPARRAIRLKAKLIKTFGPVLAQLFLLKDGEADGKSALVSAMELLSTNIEPTEYENLIVEILQGVRKNGTELQPGIIDLEFAGDMDSLYKVVFFVLEVNFANFFHMLGIGNDFNNPIAQAPAHTKKTFTKASRSSLMPGA